MSNARKKLVKVLVIATTAVLVFFVLIGGYVFWYMYTAKPAKEFCSSIEINSKFDTVQSRAKEQGFEFKEKPGKAEYEKVFAFSKQPNGESQCQVFIKNNQVIKKRYVLYL